MEEIKHKDLMIEKLKCECNALNYFENFLILVSAVSVCVSISAFSTLNDIPISITSYAVGSWLCISFNKLLT